VVSTKHKSVMQRDQYYTVKTVAPIGDKRTYDIEIEDTHNLFVRELKSRTVMSRPRSRYGRGWRVRYLCPAGKCL